APGRRQGVVTTVNYFSIDLRAFEQKGVTDDGNVGEGHGGGGDEGVEQAEGGQRDGQHIVDEGEEQVLADGAHGGAREADGGGDAVQAAADQDNVAGFLGDIRPAADGDAQVRRRQGGGV